MTGWWVADLWESNPPALVSRVVWVIGSIVLHELAHGWAAIRCGDRTPIESGHMTWNPLVHMGPMSLIAFAIVGIAWGQMPVNPNRFRGRYDDAVVSLAGPAMNLSLAITALLGACLWTAIGGGHWWAGVHFGEPLFGNMVEFFLLGLEMNLVLMLFNLLPVPPLDGSRILGSLWPPFERMWQGEQAQYVGVIAFILVFQFSGRFIWGAADNIAIAMIREVLPIFVPHLHP
jgi:Zn-dependent protease